MKTETMSKQAPHTPTKCRCLSCLNTELLKALKAARLRMLKYGESREEIAEMDTVIARASGKEQVR